MNERDQLEEEIQQLLHELSVTIPQEIQSAAELGDLRENSEFSSAVEKQHFVGVRLQQLITRLKAYKSIDLSSISRDKVGLGSLVKAKHVESNKIVYFKLVMSDINEESEKHTEVTMQSPIGKALLNKSVKDEIIVKLPRGITKYKILDIKTIHDL